MTRRGWAIWYGALLDGVTEDRAEVERAKKRGARVAPVEWEGEAVPLETILRAPEERPDPNPNDGGAP